MVSEHDIKLESFSVSRCDPSEKSETSELNIVLFFSNDTQVRMSFKPTDDSLSDIAERLQSAVNYLRRSLEH